MSVEEVLSKSKAWHATRSEGAATTSGGSGGTGSTLGTPRQHQRTPRKEEWSSSYMRKQFPASWFLSGHHSQIAYGMDSPAPLSFHGNDEMLSYLPDVLQPRYPPLERWTPEVAKRQAKQKKLEAKRRLKEEERQKQRPSSVSSSSSPVPALSSISSNQHEIHFVNVESGSTGMSWSENADGSSNHSSSKHSASSTQSGLPRVF